MLDRLSSTSSGNTRRGNLRRGDLISDDPKPARLNAVDPRHSPAAPLLTPNEEYTQRLRHFETRVKQLTAQHIRLGYVRLCVVAAFLLTAWSSFGEHYGSRWLCVLPAVLFAAVAVYHSRILRRRAVAERSAEVYRRGMARIEDRWAGTNPRDLALNQPLDQPENFYAADLDVVGRDGLFELLCTARTPMGEDLLLRWLLEPAPPHVIRERQQAIAELCGRSDFRERMAVAGDAVDAIASRLRGRNTESLLAWAEAPDTLRQRWWPWLAASLAALALAGLAAWMSRGTIAPLFLVLVIEACVRLPLKREIAGVLEGTDQTVEVLRLISALLEEMERETFTSERLKLIQAKLSSQLVSSQEIAGSVAIAHLASLGRYRDSLDNPLIRSLNLPLMYSVQLAFAIQRWRRRHGRAARLWLEALAEMEALLALATYSYEHPCDPFPEILEGESCFEAVGLGHPLLPADRCVRNDVHLGGQVRVLLVSGSNMTGKSTLMRSVGVNAVMAMCGAPVRALSLRLSPVRVGASLLVNDSLKSGQSRFYAEIERLRSICRMAEQTREPAGLDGGEERAAGVLFLLDDLLEGTNSRDRLTGAQGILRALVQNGAIGIVTTHDLALTAMEGLEAGWFRNMHFQEQIAEGRMQFDFRMREGVVATSNGMELMRLFGLNV